MEGEESAGGYSVSLKHAYYASGRGTTIMVVNVSGGREAIISAIDGQRR